MMMFLSLLLLWYFLSVCCCCFCSFFIVLLCFFYHSHWIDRWVTDKCIYDIYDYLFTLLWRHTVHIYLPKLLLPWGHVLVPSLSISIAVQLESYPQQLFVKRTRNVCKKGKRFTTRGCKTKCDCEIVVVQWCAPPCGGSLLCMLPMITLKTLLGNLWNLCTYFLSSSRVSS